jgi:hypothetical protein
VIPLTRDERAALVAMLAPAWTVDGPTIRRLIERGFVIVHARGHHLSAIGEDLAALLILDRDRDRTRKDPSCSTPTN